MEFAAAALMSIASTVGGTAAAAGTAAIGTSSIATAGALAPLTTASVGSAVAGSGTLLSALGSTSTWASVLSGAATVGSMLNTMRAGEINAGAYELAAGDAKMDARLEANQGIARRTSLKAALVEAIGERDVAAAASGVDLSFGTPVQARREAVVDAERSLNLDRQTEELRKNRLLERAASYSSMAQKIRDYSLASAIGTGLTGLSKLFARG